MALGYHIRLRLVDDGPIAQSAEERRTVARVVLEQGRGKDLLGFGLGDNHLHAETASSEPTAKELGRRIALSLGHHLPLKVGFTGAYLKPIEEGRHLYNCFRYVLGQDLHHGLELDLLREGTNLPDLLGARVLGQYTAANVRRLLPRITREDLLQLLGLESLGPIDGELDRVVGAALRAAGLSELAGRTPETVAARQAVVRIVGFRETAEQLAHRLKIGIRTVDRMRDQEGDPRLVWATMLQLDIERQLGSARRSGF